MAICATSQRLTGVKEGNNLSCFHQNRKNMRNQRMSIALAKFIKLKNHRKVVDITGANRDMASSNLAQVRTPGEGADDETLMKL